MMRLREKEEERGKGEKACQAPRARCGATLSVAPAPMRWQARLRHQLRNARNGANGTVRIVPGETERCERNGLKIVQETERFKRNGFALRNETERFKSSVGFLNDETERIGLEQGAPG